MTPIQAPQPQPPGTRLSSIRATRLAVPPEGAFHVALPREGAVDGHELAITGTICFSARRPYGKYIVDFTSEHGMKCRGARLIEGKGIGGRWSHTQRGYVVSPAALARWWAMLHAGWDAGLWGKLEPPKGSPEAADAEANSAAVLVAPLLQEIGATETEPGCWTLQTIHGALTIHPHDDWIACRFADVRLVPFDANPYSGKWNFHGKNGADVVAAFDTRVRSILLREGEVLCHLLPRTP